MSQISKQLYLNQLDVKIYCSLVLDNCGGLDRTVHFTVCSNDRVKYCYHAHFLPHQLDTNAITLKRQWEYWLSHSVMLAALYCMHDSNKQVTMSDNKTVDAYKTPRTG